MPNRMFVPGIIKRESIHRAMRSTQPKSLDLVSRIGRAVKICSLAAMTIINNKIVPRYETAIQNIFVKPLSELRKLRYIFLLKRCVVIEKKVIDSTPVDASFRFSFF